MNDLLAHLSGDCGPGCAPCANECDRCLQWLHECICDLPAEETRT